jgi:hypothetical protein
VGGRSPFPQLKAFHFSGLRQNHPAADVIVFIVGGGNYVEYQNVQEWAKSKGLQRCTYGCTEMVSPGHFVEQVRYYCEWIIPKYFHFQLAQLGQRSRAA